MSSLLHLVLLLLWACHSAGAATVEAVSTAEQLASAIQQRAPHIVITEHLDLRPLPATPTSGGQNVILTPVAATKSITGACETPPSNAGSLPGFKSPQCVLTLADNAMRFTEPGTNVWLDWLYFRAVRKPEQPQQAPYPVIRMDGAKSGLWITNTTMQGSGGTMRGVSVQDARVLLQDSHFGQFKGESRVAVFVYDTIAYTTLAIKDSVFANNTATTSRITNCRQEFSGIVGVESNNQCVEGITATLQNVTFTGNQGVDVVSPQDWIFSDNRNQTLQGEIVECFQEDDGDLGSEDYYGTEYDCDPEGPPPPHEGGPQCAALLDESLFNPCDPMEEKRANNKTLPLSQLDSSYIILRGKDMLSTSSPALQQINQARNDALRETGGLAALRGQTVTGKAPVDPGDVTGGNGDDDSNTGKIVGGVVGGVLGFLALLLLCALASVFLWRREKRQRDVTVPKASTADGKEVEESTGMLTAIPAGSFRKGQGMGTLSYGSGTAPWSEDGTHREGGSSDEGGNRRYPSLLHMESVSDSSQRDSTRPALFSAGSYPTQVPLSGASSFPSPVVGRGADSTTGPATSTGGGLATQTETAIERVVQPGGRERFTELEDMLDGLNARHERFAGRFWVHNHFHRRTGGQGLVQFMQRCQDGAELAVKFFLAHGAFEREMDFYQDSKLREILVPVVNSESNSGARVTTRGGYVFPPFIMVERGESLNEWVSRVAPDLPTTIFVLLHLAQKLEKLHDNGLCHRDIKPSNVLWRPTANAWTLMDFGCAARIGQEAELAFSVHYAPPEVIASAEAGEKTIVASGALDMWALGVISVELLIGRRMFPPPMTVDDAKDQLAGRKPLPWEDPATARPLLEQLKVLRRSVLLCLERDPAKRPTSRELLGAWNGLFESMTGCTTAQYVVPERGSRT